MTFVTKNRKYHGNQKCYQSDRQTYIVTLLLIFMSLLMTFVIKIKIHQNCYKIDIKMKSSIKI